MIWGKFLAHASNISGSEHGQLLEEHLRCVASLAEKFATKANIPMCGRLVGLLHDFGKYSKEFQSYLRSATGILNPEDSSYVDATSLKGKIIHSFAGGQHIWHRWKGKKNKPGVMVVAQLLALCVISHHSGLKDCITPNGEDAFGKAMESPEKKAHHDECLASCDSALAKEIEDLLDRPALQELARALSGMKVALDSKPAKDENSQAFCRGLLARFLLSCLVDADRTDTACFMEPEWENRLAQVPVRPWDRLVPRLEAHLAGMTGGCPIDELRREISEECARHAEDEPGLFSLTVPTGGGKTLASLRFALRHAQRHGLDRIVYVVPYTSIIEQNAAIARAILEAGETAGSIVLEHHASFQPDDDEPVGESFRRWERLTESWDAPVVITTMVQFLETLFGRSAHRARRMHNLARSVLVFDEVQTVPLRCLRMFCLAVEFLIMQCGASAVLCTATQPCLDKVPNPEQGSLRLDPKRELVHDVPSLFRRLRRTEFVLHCGKRPASLAYVASLAAEELRKKGACLVICNTKKAAETIYASCSAEMDVSRCYLSTSLCPAHRMDKLESLYEDLRKGRPVLCVSTQLIECGVDVSFPVVVRLAAGLDSVLQAAGRCNRHGEGGTLGRVHVVWAAEDGLENLPDIRHGQQIFLDMLTQCADVLKASDNDLTRPELLEWYFRTYFYRQQNRMSYAVSAGNCGLMRNDTLLRLLGSNDMSPCNIHTFLMKQSFSTASQLFEPIESQTTGVIVPYKDGEIVINELFSSEFLYKKKELLRKAQRYAVNIYANKLKILKNAGGVIGIGDSNIWALDMQFYSDEFGLILQPMSRLPILNM